MARTEIVLESSDTYWIGETSGKVVIILEASGKWFEESYRFLTNFEIILFVSGFLTSYIISLFYIF